MADLETTKREYLEIYRCYFESPDGKHVYRPAELKQDGQYNMFYRWTNREQEEAEDYLLHYTVDMDEWSVRYALELPGEYVKLLHTVARENGKYYMPTKEMCRVMPLTSEILFYSDPRNRNTDFREYATGESDLAFFGDELDWPQYRFDTEGNLTGRIDKKGESPYGHLGIDLIFHGGESVEWEAKKMADYFIKKMLPELDNCTPLVKKEVAHEIGRLVRKALVQGTFKAAGVEASGTFKELFKDLIKSLFIVH